MNRGTEALALWENGDFEGNNACASKKNNDQFVSWEGDAGVIFCKEKPRCLVTEICLSVKSSGRSRVRTHIPKIKQKDF